MPKPKSVAATLLFTVFLGPLGLLYATFWGGVFMIFLGFVVISSRYPVPVILMWIISCVWGVWAVNHYNEKLWKKE